MLPPAPRGPPEPHAPRCPPRPQGTAAPCPYLSHSCLHDLQAQLCLQLCLHLLCGWKMLRQRGKRKKGRGVRSRGTPSPIPLTRPAGHVSQREVLGVLPDTEGERRTHDAAGGHRVRPGRADPIPIPFPPRVATRRPAPSPDVDEAGGGEVHALGEELQQPHTSGQPQRPAGSRGRVRRGLRGGTRPLHQGWGPHRLGEPCCGSHFWSVTM